MTVADVYVFEVVRETPAETLIRGRFGERAEGSHVVRAIVTQLAALPLRGGRLVKLDGPLSVAGAIAVGHRLAHLYGAVAMFDPKVGGYIIAVSHDPTYAVGDVLPTEHDDCSSSMN